jgi:hypothetical protein
MRKKLREEERLTWECELERNKGHGELWLKAFITIRTYIFQY